MPREGFMRKRRSYCLARTFIWAATPGLKTGLRERSGSVDNAAIFHRKARAVPWAFHTFAIELPFGKRAPRCAPFGFFLPTPRFS